MSMRLIEFENQFKTLVSAVAQYHREVGAGTGPGRNTSTAPSDWSTIAGGKTLGKKVVVLWDGLHATKPTTIDMLTVEGPDINAHQFTLTLVPPKMVPFNAEFARTSTQNITGEMDNQQLFGLPTEILLPQCSAIIEWGIGGISNSVEADFSNGLCLNLTASFLRVRAKVEGNPDVDTTAGAVVLGAFVGPGIAKPNNAQKTIAIEAFINTNFESAVFPIPTYAKTAHLVMSCTDQGAGNFNPLPYSGYLRFWGNSDGPTSAFAIPMGDHRVTSDTQRPIVVPNEAYFFTVYNTSVAPGIQLTPAKVVFDLAV